MKVTVNGVEKKEGIIELPKLLESSLNKGLIILAYKIDGIDIHGVVLQQGESIHSVGHTSVRWAKAVFKPFKGSITLENDNL